MRPSLIHAQTIVAKLAPTNVVTDASLGEPAGRVVGASITFRAQVQYGTPLEGQKTFGVLMPDARGYLIALNSAPASTLPKGARIISISGQPVNLVVLDNVPAGHYTSATLRYIPFAEANS